MAFDIYGNRLERGHCEVHSYVHEEYPCSICYMENNRDRKEKQFRKEQEMEYEREYWAEMEREQFLSIPIIERDKDLLTDKRF